MFVRIQIISVLFSLMIVSCRNAETNGKGDWQLCSPDKNIRIDISFETSSSNSRILNYKVSLGNKNVIESSQLGVYMPEEGGNLTDNLDWVNENTAVINETYELPSGKKRVYPNHCNELTLRFRNQDNRELDVVFRAYNDGIAYRYRIPGEGAGTISSEASSFRIPEGSRCWGQPVNERNCHESSFETGIAGKDFLPDEKIWFPVLYTNPDTAFWALLTEAAVYGTYCGSHLEYRNGSYKVILHDTTVTSPLPWETPWRVAIIGKNLVPIVETNLVENLNPPSETNDMSWIKPGRTSWTWWYAGEPNPANEKIDPKEWDSFATNEMGWEYGCSRQQMWWDWTGHYEEDTVAFRDVLLRKGPLEQSIAEDLKKRSSEGVVIHKCDFMDSDSQERMKDYDLIARACMENKIMINWHGARLPGGERRRWPNMVGYEGVLGAEFYKWSDGPGLFHRLTLPFTRNVVGPMDFTGVTFGYPADGKRNNSDAAELATAMLYENGIQYWGSPPKEYRKRPAAMSFLKDCPVAWETTRYIDGFPGRYVCLARRMRGQDKWFIGAMANNTTDEPKQVSFSFLPAGKQYKLELHRDGKRGETIITDRMTITSESTVNIHVLANGGFCGVLEPVLEEK